MRGSRPAKKTEPPGPVSDEALYRSMTRYSRISQPGQNVPGKTDKVHESGETDPAEPAADESETIDPSEFGKKISAMTSLDRDAALRLASDLVIRLHHRTCTKRFREQEGDRTRVAYARVLVAAIQAYGSILKDGELDELKKRIAALETAKGIDNGNN